MQIKHFCAIGKGVYIMSEECTHDCSSCGSNCAERVEEQKNKDNYAGVKKVIAVVSGKGGVGKDRKSVV